MNFDLDHIGSYTKNNTNASIGFFELGLEQYTKQLDKIIPNLSIELLEILSYTILKISNIKYFFTEDVELKKIHDSLIQAIEKEKNIRHKLNTGILYNLITHKSINTNVLEERFNKVNICHYVTWAQNIDANSYIAIILNKERNLCSPEYVLGVELRKILINNYPENKSDILTLIIEKVKKFNIIYDNWFSYNNSILIGEVISTFGFDDNSIKIFLKELIKYDSVVTITTILYKICLTNKELFKSITNVKMLNNIYKKTTKQLSYYEDNSHYEYMFATMMSTLDVYISDKYFIKALNNGIFRPAFKGEDLVSNILPECIFLAYQNDWYETRELESYVYRTFSMCKIMNNTTDNGGSLDMLKEVIVKCLPRCSLLDELNDVSSSNVLKENYLTSTESKIKNISVNDIEKYYSCKEKNINYNDLQSCKIK